MAELALRFVLSNPDVRHRDPGDAKHAARRREHRRRGGRAARRRSPRGASGTPLGSRADGVVAVALRPTLDGGSAPMRILLVSQMYPGADSPGAGRVRPGPRTRARGTRARASRAASSITRADGAGTPSLLRDVVRTARALPARRGLRALPRPRGPARRARRSGAARRHRARAGRSKRCLLSSGSRRHPPHRLHARTRSLRSRAGFVTSSST